MDQTQLIIGVTGRMCAGKRTLAGLIQKKTKSKNLIYLSSTFNTHQFWTTFCERLRDQALSKNVLELPQEQLNLLDVLIKEIKVEITKDPLKELDLITKAMFDWKNLSIVAPITNSLQVQLLKQKNYFHLIAIETPLLLRYKNFCTKYQEFSQEVSLDLFSYVDDQLNIHDNIQDQSKVLVENSGSEKDLFLNLMDQYENVIRPIRPSWDQWFMYIAHIVKQRSNCMKRAVGAVLTKNNRIQATGYNGTPNGKTNCFEGGCARCNNNVHQGKDLEKCFCFHAEESAIIESGTNNSQGCSLYTTLFPCYQCSKILLAAGITKVFYEEDYDNNAKGSELHKYMKVQKVCTKDYVY